MSGLSLLSAQAFEIQNGWGLRSFPIRDICCCNIVIKTIQICFSLTERDYYRYYFPHNITFFTHILKKITYTYFSNLCFSACFFYEHMSYHTKFQKRTTNRRTLQQL